MTRSLTVPMLVLAAALVAHLLPQLAVAEDEAAAESSEEVFDVTGMLRAACDNVREKSPLQILQDEAAKIEGDCLPMEARNAWRKGFQDAVDTMLSKTRRSMQQGLEGVGQCTTNLLAASSCGELKAFAKLGDQAARLKVLAGSRSLGNLDSKVKYEPLKALMLGDYDIHKELNRLIIAWQLKKGSEETGRALAEFLRVFAEEGSEDPPAVTSKSEPTPVSVGTPKADVAAGDDRLGVDFWQTVLNIAAKTDKDSSDSVAKECISTDAAHNIGKGVEKSFNTMLEKNRRSMQTGVKILATAMGEFLEVVGVQCPNLSSSLGLRSLKSAASRMSILAGAKTLVNFGVHVEYEAMKTLKIGGIDVHLELNRFIYAWLNKSGAQQLGEGLAGFFADFKEEVEEPPVQEKDVKENSLQAPIVQMILDAFSSAGSATDLKEDCISEDDQNVKEFLDSVNAALEHMLQKRKRSMQQGLKELADCTDRLLSALPGHCTATEGAQTIWKAAKKVKTLTRRTVVDYGTYIKYEAMKSLTVGNVAIHLELNGFIGAWKLRSIAEAGSPFGKLMKKLATIEGHDEL